MKKTTTVVAIAAALVLAYGGTSWFIGKKAQTRITEAVQQANQNLVGVLGPDFSGDDISIDIVSYERGVFSSDVQYVMRLHDAEGEPIELLLQDKLQHGPFPVGAVASGNLMPALAFSRSRLLRTEALAPWFEASDGEPLQIETLIRLGGDGVSNWRFAPVALAEEDVRIDFSGGELKMEFASTLDEGVATGGFDRLDIRDGDGILQIHQVTMQSDASRNDDGVLQSDSQASIAQLIVSGAGLADVDFTGVQAAFSSEQQGNLMDADLRYEFAAVKADGVDLGGMVLRLAAQRLDMQVLNELSAMSDQINETGSIMDDAQAQIVFDKLKAMLKNNPSLAIDPLSWKNEKGESHLQLNVALKEADVSQAAMPELAYVDDAKLELMVSRDMFLHAVSRLQDDDNDMMRSFAAMLFDQYAARLQAAGLVTQTDGNLAATVTYDDGNIVLNGTAMSLEEFMQRLRLVTM